MRIIKKTGTPVPARGVRRLRNFNAAKKAPRGSTLIELMLAISILIIVILGTSSTFVTGRYQIASQRYYQVAAQLASQKLEQIKAVGYTGTTEGEESQDFTFYGLDFQRNTVTVLTAEPSVEVPKPCYRVTVTIQWTGTAGDQHQAEFVTYVGP